MKLLFKLFLISLLLSLLIVPLRGGYLTIFSVTGFRLCSIVGFIVLGIWTVFCIYKYSERCKPVYLLSAILLGSTIIDLIFRLRDFSSTMISFPSLLIWCMGVFSGYVVAIIPQKKYQVSFAILALFAGTWLSLPGYNMFLHNLNFGSFKGNINEKLSIPLFVQKADGETIDSKDIFNEYLVLDFWNSTCGVCFRDFPKVQELYDKFKKYPQLSFYSVHCRRSDKGETFETGQHVLQKHNYSFPTVSMDIKSQTLDMLGVTCYPTVLIIDSSSNIVFRGNVDRAIDKLYNLTYGMQ